ncbi:gpi-anchored cell wall beta- -endoglucanase [Lasius niger]|uniref:Gpi-anchored cell wall beta--endoglucanase n=1 Tax=Lasius niger TaxID=67767 RepID=A0A0J7K3R9_LASNI|nr:gpi-anchored cell wall beta- -endoglucanase [Lasius niger]
MTASSTSFTPTAQEEQMADEPVASSSHSATDTQRIKQQVEAPLTVFPRPGVGYHPLCILNYQKSYEKAIEKDKDAGTPAGHHRTSDSSTGSTDKQNGQGILDTIREEVFAR